MADLILGPLMDVTISKVISATTEQLNLAVGFKQELKKFRVVLSMVRGVLQDAEEKKVTGYSDLQPWLKELEYIIDEADNVVDEIAYEHLRYKVAQKHMWKKVSYFFTLSNPLAFRLKIANRIKDLNLDLASLNDWATGLGLQYRLANKFPEQIEIQQTDSSIGDASNMVGRKKEVPEVVQSLIDSSNDQSLHVVSIVGMGGIGKTTMAKLVCNNEQIRRCFFKIIWVCVSKNFEVIQILVEMLKTVTDDNKVEHMSQNSLVKKLQEKMEEKAKEEKLKEEARKDEPEGKAKKDEHEGKKYLLILDDVWDEDTKKLESLRNCLLTIGEKVGGRVLVTTRSKNVASLMGTPPDHIHDLRKLADEDCWSKDVWLSIKNNSEEWGSIQEVGGVLRVLQLSFNRLPTPALKQCFAFCSIFPKDFVMEKEMLIQLWMGEGYLQPSRKRYKEMEDIGGKYFNDLFSYSLFQDAKKDSYGSIISCKVHDFIHDLAQSVSESQTLILEGSSSSDIAADIRHLNLISKEGMPETKIRELRTLFSRVNVSQNKLENFIKVRVLSFCGANIDELPAFLGKMKHLRFLDVSETKIKELPKFITKLYHLQTFRFMNCGEIKRPLKGIWDLVNLRHIYFNDEKLMPAGIGGLTCLKTLQLFVVGQQKGHQIEELGCLSQLRGKLEIRNLDMVRDKEEAMGARLSEKGTIQELQLQFGGESNLSEDRCKQDLDILEGLQPHSNLKGLTIEHYCGKGCPSWMLETKNFLKNLMSMTFSACPWLQSIPSLSLSKEAQVEIKNCKNLKSIADSSLQQLIIKECEELVGVEVGQAAMKSLKEVHIEDCGKLENLPMISKLQSLEVLELQQCTELKMIGDDAPFISTCLQELNIRNCYNLMSMSSVYGSSSLQKIVIGGCGQLKSIGEDLSTATCLKELIIWSCNGLMSFPNLHGLSSLQKIVIVGCGQLKSIGEDLSTATCLKELTVGWCKGLMSFPNLHGLSSLQKIEIHWCGQLESIGEDLSTVTCLKELTVSGCNGLMSFPNLHGLSALQRIEIRECGQLKSIGEDLSTVTCLKELTVRWCNGLMSFPNLYGLSSLQNLWITGCGGLRSLPSGLPSCTAIKELDIANCDNLISIPDDLRRSWSIPNPACLARLKWLSIGGFSTELKEFPDLGFIGSHLEGLTLIAWGEPRECLLDQIQHLTALKSLGIRDFDGLEALPNWFGNLSSLQTLTISDCKSLKHMKAIRCISKLESLDIDGCPELKERCTRGSGAEWDCISHIRNIKIDYRWIQREGAPIEDDDSEQQVDDNEQQDDDSEQLPVRATGLRRFICCRN
ncbi:hypothetical protein SLEP1_g28932 [Rubroshorea leprosula]|uniref:Uncharacterized protein n=1 Tax=Rubroshorea leprosula TaxID=152421 RepID=A0AAV5K3X0_9ROSI|nr:hypothetical protein SLEP1_g28932 [Rubroshorea leprosula]